MAPENLRDGLLASEDFSPEFKSRYDKELGAIMETTLPTWQRIAWGLSGLLGLSFFIGFGYTAWTLPDDLSPIIQGEFAFASLFGAGWMALAWSIAYKGKMNVGKHQGIAAGMTWVMVIVMMTGFLFLAGQMEDAAKGNYMVLFGLVFMIFGVVVLLQHTIKQSELSVREGMLRLELQLAELTEKISAKNSM